MSKTQTGQPTNCIALKLRSSSEALTVPQHEHSQSSMLHIINLMSLLYLSITAGGNIGTQTHPGRFPNTNRCSKSRIAETERSLREDSYSFLQSSHQLSILYDDTLSSHTMNWNAQAEAVKRYPGPAPQLLSCTQPERPKREA